MLAQSGITSVTCLQLDELLEALRTDTFDVLLTDVQMPAMNGFDLLRLLRASNIPQAKTIPVIAVTARSDMKREEFLQHGFAGSLHKPFTVNELLAEIGVLQADIATVDAAPSSTLNFSALTAFSGDDPDAAKSILESFVTETRLNVDRLRQALETEVLRHRGLVFILLLRRFFLHALPETVVTEQKFLPEGFFQIWIAFAQHKILVQFFRCKH